jgi:hypothetical protein
VRLGVELRRSDRLADPEARDRRVAPGRFRIRGERAAGLGGGEVRRDGEVGFGEAGASEPCRFVRVARSDSWSNGSTNPRSVIVSPGAISASR